MYFLLISFLLGKNYLNIQENILIYQKEKKEESLQIIKEKQLAIENESQNNEYLEAKIPKTHELGSLFNSFWVGGLICCLGQGINDTLLSIFPTLAEATAWGYTLVILIFLGSFLTAIGVYDRIGKFAGGGSIVPITGFSNSISSPSIEFKKEGIIYGICVKMFTIAGPVIVCGVVGSIICGLVGMFI